jgi:hypothetical protein
MNVGENASSVRSRAVADSYRSFILELAVKFTNSKEEAEAAVREMQADIERCGGKTQQFPSNEERLIAGIAWRRLLKYVRD